MPKDNQHGRGKEIVLHSLKFLRGFNSHRDTAGTGATTAVGGKLCPG